MLRTAVLVSGSGTTAEQIILAAQNHILKAVDPVVVISSTPDAGAIERVKKYKIPVEIVNRCIFSSSEDFGKALISTLNEYKINLVSQNGWLPFTPLAVVKTYKNRIINQHPGPLDPDTGRDFGGRGMYGKRVMCARLIYCGLTKKDYWTVATTHIVTEHYDIGEILRTEKMKLPHIHFKDFDEIVAKKNEIITLTENMQSKLFPLEYSNVIETLREISENDLNKKRKTKLVIPSSKKDILEKSKQLAISFFPHG